MSASPQPPPPRRARPGDVVTVDVRDPSDLPPQPPGDFPVAGGQVRTLEINTALLDANDRVAAANRKHFKALGLRVVNLVSSPGAGKTSLLARTLEALAPEVRCGVLVGDLETDNDARRLRHAAVPVAQITTGSACHLDAGMIARVLDSIDHEGLRLLFVENVDNLVCPASFDLGETVRVTLFSCTEGEDKPLKYPPLYKSAHVVILTKIDLAEAAGFDRAAARENVRRMAPQARAIETSARTGEGVDDWLGFLRSLL
ncbi:MAG TPA: hydrogenase nickel incorporation protein HypB [Opitutaceae bacterium]